MTEFLVVTDCYLNLRDTSYRTLRDGAFKGRWSRHFVPGYDRIFPPGHSQQALARIGIGPNREPEEDDVEDSDDAKQHLLFGTGPCALPEGGYDRSLARSAWDIVPRKHRPVGYDWRS